MEKKTINYQDINAATIDRWVEEGWEWGKPIDHETFLKAANGEWDIVLTPTKPVPHEWFGQIKGKHILGLAAGGGQQMPIFAALGAECTVLDYSEKQLESEKLVAAREGYDINIVRADMTKPLPFENESFDLIFHPVSNGYEDSNLLVSHLLFLANSSVFSLKAIILPHKHAFYATLKRILVFSALLGESQASFTKP